MMFVQPSSELPPLALMKSEKRSFPGRVTVLQKKGTFCYEVSRVGKESEKQQGNKFTSQDDTTSRREYFANAARKSRLKRKREMETLSETVSLLEQEQVFFLKKIRNLQLEVEFMARENTLWWSKGGDARRQLEYENQLLKEEVDRHRNMTNTVNQMMIFVGHQSRVTSKAIRASRRENLLKQELLTLCHNSVHGHEWSKASTPTLSLEDGLLMNSTIKAVQLEEGPSLCVRLDILDYPIPFKEASLIMEQTEGPTTTMKFWEEQGKKIIGPDLEIDLCRLNKSTLALTHAEKTREQSLFQYKECSKLRKYASEVFLLSNIEKTKVGRSGFQNVEDSEVVDAVLSWFSTFNPKSENKEFTSQNDVKDISFMKLNAVTRAPNGNSNFTSLMRFNNFSQYKSLFASPGEHGNISDMGIAQGMLQTFRPYLKLA